mmetsp:Transcript_26358/g.46751  ORF Transcript_26358/g.46751 Transcript_26358/m.46751 type:complete len:436 (-) Transcript_26358:357-1664(-)
MFSLEEFQKRLVSQPAQHGSTKAEAISQYYSIINVLFSSKSMFQNFAPDVQGIVSASRQLTSRVPDLPEILKIRSTPASFGASKNQLNLSLDYCFRPSDAPRAYAALDKALDYTVGIPLVHPDQLFDPMNAIAVGMVPREVPAHQVLTKFQATYPELGALSAATIKKTYKNGYPGKRATTTVMVLLPSSVAKHRQQLLQVLRISATTWKLQDCTAFLPVFYTDPRSSRDIPELINNMAQSNTNQIFLPPQFWDRNAEPLLTFFPDKASLLEQKDSKLNQIVIERARSDLTLKVVRRNNILPLRVGDYWPDMESQCSNHSVPVPLVDSKRTYSATSTETFLSSSVPSPMSAIQSQLAALDKKLEAISAQSKSALTIARAAYDVVDSKRNGAPPPSSMVSQRHPKRQLNTPAKASASSKKTKSTPKAPATKSAKAKK